MKYGMMFKQGDVVIVPFPFSDLSSIKQRPVLVLSKSDDLAQSDDIVTCGITSYLKDARHSILLDNNDLIEGSIPKRSRIKIDKLFTLDKKIIKKKVGRLKKEVFDKVRDEFRKLI